MMALTTESAPGRQSGQEPVPPRADCVADSAGGLTFDVTGVAQDGGTHLVLRARGDDETEVRLPLTPVGGGRLRAALPCGVDLPEDRWDVCVRTADGASRRLQPGLNDLRSLMGRSPDPGAERITVRIPYVTRHGNLSVRSWRRAPHAEAGELRVGAAELTVRGQVHGTPLTPEAYAELRGHGASAPVVRADVAVQDTEFVITLPYAAPAPDEWDLWLLPAGGSGPGVRVARLLDDIVDKKSIFTYPQVRLETAAGTRTVRAYYTTDNDLSVSVASAS